MDAYITGLGSFYPNQPVPNDRVEDILGRIDGQPSWAGPIILESCGIKARHYAIDPETGRLSHTNAQMTAEAVRDAVARGGHELADVDLLACGTSTPDQLNPGHAVMTLGLLKSRPLEAVSFTGFCASGMAALRYAYLSVLTGQRRLAAATGSELISALFRGSRFKVPQNDVGSDELRSNPALSMNKEFLRFIGADGAACLLVSPEPARQGPSFRIDWIDSCSLANEYPTCMYQGAEKDRKTGELTGWLHVADIETAVERNFFTVTQDVGLLKRFIAETAVNRVLRDVVTRRRLRPEAYDWVLPHLSSYFFKPQFLTALEQIGFGIPEERFYVNLHRVGNLGSAALGSMLEQGAREGRFEKGQRLLCCVPESGRFTFYYMQLTVV